MALTAAEQAEMDSLEKDLGKKKASGLSPAEQAEMAQLEGDVGHLAPAHKMETMGDRITDYFSPGGASRLGKKISEDPEAQAYTAKNNEEQRQAGSRDLRTLVDYTPAAAGVAGTILGGPVGGLRGAALGEGAKAGLKNLFYDEGPKNAADLVEDVGKGVATQGIAELGGYGAAKLGGYLAKAGVGEAVGRFAKPGVDKIMAAAERLGYKPTQGMLTDDYITRGTENSLSQSPSIPGAMIRNEQQPVIDAMKNTGAKLTEGASSEGGYQAGREIKKGIGEYFENRLEPLRQSYKEIESHTKSVALDPKSQARIANNIRNIDEARFEGSEGHAVANNFAKWLEGAKDVNDIKLLKTKAGNILRDQASSTEERAAAGQILDKLDQFHNNSITRGAVSVAREGAETRTAGGKFLNKGEQEVAGQEAEAEGKDLGRRLIGDIKSTNKAYRGFKEDLTKFGKGSGMTKANKGPQAALNDVESFNNQDVAPAMFDTGNVDFLKFVQEKMPKEFEAARGQKLAEIVAKARNAKGDLDVAKLVKITDKLDPEAKSILFGKEGLLDLDALSVTTKSIPEKVGASDTPRGLAFKDIINPVQNLKDAGAYGLLKLKPKVPQAGLLLQKSRPGITGLINRRASDE